ncbi:MAG TPA: hypothetical protein VFW07_22905 [Parafilimonas sp.]|nr:hypothetical protein [Parafilimonas sp.]
MKNNSNKKREDQDPMKDYNPGDRDFQRTEEDIDNVSKSEKEELERRKQRIHEGSTKPDKNHIG